MLNAHERLGYEVEATVVFIKASVHPGAPIIKRDAPLIEFGPPTVRRRAPLVQVSF